MNETIKDRLIKFLSHLQIGQGKFEKNCGMSNGTINNIKDGLSSPNLSKIRKAYPNLSLEWLITGEGSMLKDESNSIIIGAYDSNELAQVPFVSIAATASFVETFCDETLIKETVGVEGYTQEEISRYGYIVIEVSGCSMEPTIMNKARILCKRVSPSDWEYFSKGIYVVGYGRDMLVVKRVKHNDLLEKGTLTLYSDNIEYGELTIPKSAIRCIWKGLEIVKQKLL